MYERPTSNKNKHRNMQNSKAQVGGNGERETSNVLPNISKSKNKYNLPDYQRLENISRKPDGEFYSPKDYMRNSETFTPSGWENITNYQNIVNMQQVNVSNITLPNSSPFSLNTINLHSYNYPSFFYHFFGQPPDSAQARDKRKKKMSSATVSTGFSHISKSTKEDMLSTLKDLYQPKSRKASGFSEEKNSLKSDKPGQETVFTRHSSKWKTCTGEELPKINVAEQPNKTEKKILKQGHLNFGPKSLSIDVTNLTNESAVKMTTNSKAQAKFNSFMKRPKKSSTSLEKKPMFNSGSNLKDVLKTVSVLNISEEQTPRDNTNEKLMFPEEVDEERERDKIQSQIYSAKENNNNYKRELELLLEKGNNNNEDNNNPKSPTEQEHANKDSVSGSIDKINNNEGLHDSFMNNNPISLRNSLTIPVDGTGQNPFFESLEKENQGGEERKPDVAFNQNLIVEFQKLEEQKGENPTLANTLFNEKGLEVTNSLPLNLNQPKTENRGLFQGEEVCGDRDSESIIGETIRVDAKSKDGESNLVNQNPKKKYSVEEVLNGKNSVEEESKLIRPPILRPSNIQSNQNALHENESDKSKNINSETSEGKYFFEEGQLAQSLKTQYINNPKDGTFKKEADLNENSIKKLNMNNIGLINDSETKSNPFPELLPSSEIVEEPPQEFEKAGAGKPPGFETGNIMLGSGKSEGEKEPEGLIEREKPEANSKQTLNSIDLNRHGNPLDELKKEADSLGERTESSRKASLNFPLYENDNIKPDVEKNTGIKELNSAEFFFKQPAEGSKNLDEAKNKAKPEYFSRNSKEEVELLINQIKDPFVPGDGDLTKLNKAEISSPPIKTLQNSKVNFIPNYEVKGAEPELFGRAEPEQIGRAEPEPISRVEPEQIGRAGPESIDRAEPESGRTKAELLDSMHSHHSELSSEPAHNDKKLVLSDHSDPSPNRLEQKASTYVAELNEIASREGCFSRVNPEVNAPLSDDRERSLTNKEIKKLGGQGFVDTKNERTSESKEGQKERDTHDSGEKEGIHFKFDHAKIIFSHKIQEGLHLSPSETPIIESRQEKDDFVPEMAHITKKESSKGEKEFKTFLDLDNFESHKFLDEYNFLSSRNIIALPSNQSIYIEKNLPENLVISGQGGLVENEKSVEGAVLVETRNLLKDGNAPDTVIKNISSGKEGEISEEQKVAPPQEIRNLDQNFHDQVESLGTGILNNKSESKADEKQQAPGPIRRSSSANQDNDDSKIFVPLMKKNNKKVLETIFENSNTFQDKEPYRKNLTDLEPGISKLATTKIPQTKSIKANADEKTKNQKQLEKTNLIKLERLQSKDSQDNSGEFERAKEEEAQRISKILNNQGNTQSLLDRRSSLKVEKVIIENSIVSKRRGTVQEDITDNNLKSEVKSEIGSPTPKSTTKEHAVKSYMFRQEEKEAFEDLKSSIVEELTNKDLEKFKEHLIIKRREEELKSPLFSPILGPSSQSIIEKPHMINDRNTDSNQSLDSLKGDARIKSHSLNVKFTSLSKEGEPIKREERKSEITNRSFNGKQRGIADVPIAIAEKQMIRKSKSSKLLLMPHRESTAISESHFQRRGTKSTTRIALKQDTVADGKSYFNIDFSIKRKNLKGSIDWKHKGEEQRAHSKPKIWKNFQKKFMFFIRKTNQTILNVFPEDTRKKHYNSHDDESKKAEANGVETVEKKYNQTIPIQQEDSISSSEEDFESLIEFSHQNKNNKIAISETYRLFGNQDHSQPFIINILPPSEVENPNGINENVEEHIPGTLLNLSHLPFKIADLNSKSFLMETDSPIRPTLKHSETFESFDILRNGSIQIYNQLPVEDNEDYLKEKEENDLRYKSFKKVLYENEKKLRQVPFKHTSINTFIKKYFLIYFEYVIGTELTHYSRQIYLRHKEKELTIYEELKEKRSRRQRKKRLLEFIFCAKFYRCLVQMGGRFEKRVKNSEVIEIHFHNIDEVFEDKCYSKNSRSKHIIESSKLSDHSDSEKNSNDNADSFPSDEEGDWDESDEDLKFEQDLNFSNEQLQEFIRDEPQYDIQLERRLLKLNFDECRLHPINFMKKIDLYQSMNKNMRIQWTSITFSQQIIELENSIFQKREDISVKIKHIQVNMKSIQNSESEVFSLLYFREYSRFFLGDFEDEITIPKEEKHLSTIIVENKAVKKGRKKRLKIKALSHVVTNKHARSTEFRKHTFQESSVQASNTETAASNSNQMKALRIPQFEKVSGSESEINQEWGTNQGKSMTGTNNHRLQSNSEIKVSNISPLSSTNERSFNLTINPPPIIKLNENFQEKILEVIDQPTPACRLKRQETLETEKRKEISPKVVFKSTFDRISWHHRNNTGSNTDGEKYSGKPGANNLLHVRAGSSKNILSTKEETEKVWRSHNSIGNKQTHQPKSPENDLKSQQSPGKLNKKGYDTSTYSERQPFEEKKKTLVGEKKLDNTFAKASVNKISRKSEIDKELEKNEKMDRGSLLMRTHIISLNKRKEMNPVQQMFWAIKNDKIHELEELCMIYPSLLVDKRDDDGNTMLILTCKGGNIDMVNSLLSKGANVNYANNEGFTPLHMALAYGFDDVADRLILAGANQLIRNKEGRTPWDMHFMRK